MKDIGKKLLWFLIIVLALVYLIGLVFFSMNTFPKTTVNGVDKGLVNKDTLFIADPNFGNIQVKGRNNKQMNIDLAKIDFTTSVAGKPEAKQNAFLWPLGLFSKHEYKVKYNNNFNKAKLDDLINKSGILNNMAEPQNAVIEFDTDSDKFVIKPEQEGTKIKKERLLEALEDGINAELDVIDLEGYYEEPKLRANDPILADQLKKIEAVSTQEYIFDFEDRKYALTGKELVDLFDDTDEGKVLNVEKTEEYVRGIAKETDTYGKPRKFKATGLGEITVPPGIYGWQINVKETSKKLVEQILAGKEGTAEIIYRSTPDFVFKGLSRKVNDIGDTYIEIDLSRQTMWYYEKGKLVVTTPIVTGNAMKEDDNGFRNATTPVGVNKVWSKEKERVLSGESEVTGDGYDVEVDYWMNIGWTGSGIHDSNRTKYGGTIYENKGSSSCVNTPKEAMKILFEKVKLNTPVVTYESSTEYSPTEFEKQDYYRKRDAEKEKKEAQ